jgi:hypothetical protein
MRNSAHPTTRAVKTVTGTTPNSTQLGGQPDRGRYDDDTRWQAPRSNAWSHYHIEPDVGSRRN